MSSPQQLGDAASELRSAAHTYATVAEEVLGIVVSLSGIVYGLLTTWSGLGSEGFATAQKQTARDGYRIVEALNDMAVTMNGLAGAIEANLAPVTNAQELEIHAVNLPQIGKAEAAAQTALAAITSAANKASGTLTSEVMPTVNGGCSTGLEVLAAGQVDGITQMFQVSSDGTTTRVFVVPPSGMPTANGDGPGDGGNMPPNSNGDDNGCHPRQDFMDLLNGLWTDPKGFIQKSFTGIFLTAIAGPVSGAFNATNTLLHNKLDFTNPAVLNQVLSGSVGGLFGPINYSLAKSMRNCIPDIKGHNMKDQKYDGAYYTLTGSFLGGVLEGGLLNYFVFSKLLPTVNAHPAPAPGPAPTAPAPTPTR